MQLGVQASLCSANTARDSPFFDQTAISPMCFQVRGINHYGVRFCAAGCPVAEYSIKDIHPRPADKAIVKRLIRSTVCRCIPSSQAIADDVENSADDRAVIDTRLVAGSWEGASDTLKFTFSKPIVIRHGQFLPPI